MTLLTPNPRHPAGRRGVAAGMGSGEGVGLSPDQEALLILKEAGWGVAQDMVYSRINEDEV